MSEIPPVSDEITSDDRLWALLSYLLTPIVPIIIMLMEDKKTRPFIKAHYVQALALGIVLVIVSTILAFIPVVNCIMPIVSLLLMIFYAVKAYRGEYIDIPVLTSFVKGQGWA
jgi:uncharacterized membrane protein